MHQAILCGVVAVAAGMAVYWEQQQVRSAVSAQVGQESRPASQARAAAEEPRRWAFEPEPDAFSAEALLDLRSLNEETAGQSGFVTVDSAGDFRGGDGKPLRFWAVNTFVARERPFKPRPLWSAQREADLDRHARFLAKRGVNMVRLHAHINPHPGGALTDIDAGERDWIWRTVAAMKKQGIYTTVSPYWANTLKIGPNWGVPGGPDQPTHALLFFDETLQRGYRAWLKELLTVPNPSTGIALANDPAVAIIQIQNEDSLLFWTINNLKGEQRRRLGVKFGRWLGGKYGSFDKALAAWNTRGLAGDDRNAGVADFLNIWEMTQNRTGGVAKRLDDQLQFWCETMHQFHEDVIRYLRDVLRCRQLVNAGNWKTADVGRLNDAERWTYTPGEVLAVNHYFGGAHVGPNQGWAIVNGDQFTEKSALLEPQSLPINLKQVVGKAMMVTEGGWVTPNGRAVESPFLLAAYQSLTGVDSFFYFALSDEGFSRPQSANGYMPSLAKWSMGTPDVLGQFPAAAWMYRKAMIQKAAPVVVERRALEDLWRRKNAVIQEESGFDPNRDSGNLPPRSNVKSPLPWQAFLVGPVQVEYDADPSRTEVVDLSQWVDPREQVIKSLTGELSMDYRRGVCVLDAPGAQGVAAFFEASPTIKTRDLTITCRNKQAVVLAVALDDQPLARSRRVLVQVGTPSRPKDWRTKPTTVKVDNQRVDGFVIEDHGKAPWMIEEPQVRLIIANPSLSKAIVLDPNGMATSRIPLEKVDAGTGLVFPTSAISVILE